MKTNCKRVHWSCCFGSGFANFDSDVFGQIFCWSHKLVTKPNSVRLRADYFFCLENRHIETKITSCFFLFCRCTCSLTRFIQRVLIHNLKAGAAGGLRGFPGGPPAVPPASEAQFLQPQNPESRIQKSKSRNQSFRNHNPEIRVHKSESINQHPIIRIQKS